LVNIRVAPVEEFGVYEGFVHAIAFENAYSPVRKYDEKLFQIELLLVCSVVIPREVAGSTLMDSATLLRSAQNDGLGIDENPLGFASLYPAYDLDCHCERSEATH
jgi:hypothetical protein